MTLEEAKKILEKEGFKLDGPGKTHAVSGHFTEFEPLYIYEAMQVVTSAGYNIMMSVEAFDARKARLKKEYEENTKAPGSSENRIKEDSGVNPALAESASQFNDALLDEQGKKIKRLGKEISRLNGIIHDKNEEIKRKTKGCCELVAENVDLKEDLRNTESLLHDTREANSRNLDTCFKNEDLIDELKKKLAEKTKLAKKYAKELSDSSLGLCKLEKQLKDKDAVLSDVAEELRLTKIREKNLAELGLKYIGENEKLKKKLADKIVNEIDARALKSTESALAYKEKVIAEKDEVIADLGKELAATKKELEEKKLEHAKKIRVSSDNAEEGADLYGVIVLCGKDYIDALKKAKDADIWQE
jgi:chromosome segregation ATPase